MNGKILLRRLIVAIGIISITLTWITPSYALPSMQMEKTAANSIAVIRNSGSTNTCPYVIHVSLSFSAKYTTCKSQQGQGQLPRALTKKFFHDIEAAQPLAALPHKLFCIKSKSFGTKTYIEYGAQKSPDVSCSSDPLGVKLANDAQAIQATLDFSTVMVRQQ
jgi:hypothetical protein